VNVVAPKQKRASSSATRAPRRSAASGAPRAIQTPQAAPSAAPVERANGPVSGFVATRSATATKTDTPIIETPQSISVITADQVKTQGAESIGAALRYSAGVSGDVNGGSDTRNGGLQFRGFDMTMQGLFLNGLRLPSTTYVHFLPLEPYGAERLEVLKGPSSTLFGQSGPGGVLNYVSKLPTAREFGEISLSGGSFNRYQAEFDVGGRANKEGSVLWRLTGVGRIGETQVDFTKDNRVFIAPAVTFKPNEDTTLTVLAHYQMDKTGWGLQFLPPSGTVWPNAGRTIPVNRFVGEPGFNKFDTEQASIGYLLSHNYNDAITFRQNMRYAWLHNDQQSFYGAGYANAADEAAGLLSRGGAEGNSTIGSLAIDNQFEGRFTTGILSHTTLFGIDYRRTSFKDTGASYSTGKLDVFNPVYTNSWVYNGVYDKARTSQSQVGIYAQDQIKLGRLSFLVGGRQDFAETTVDDLLKNTSARSDASAFTSRVGMMYNFESGVAPYVSYSESFLPVLDRNAAGQLLEPETGKQYEAGVKFQPRTMNALFTMAVYDLTRSNVVRYNPPSYAALQTGEIRSRGVELEAIVNPIPGWNIRGGYAYTDAVVTKDAIGGIAGKIPVTVPLHRASLWSDYTLQEGTLAGLQFGGGVRYVGATFGDDANTFKVPSSTVFDALLAYTNGNYRAALNLTNLTDRRFVAACYGNTSCFYAEGRKAVLKLSYRW
jgi:iron complex outermembrane recepter protein